MKSWDDLKNELGITRAAMIRRAVDVYKMFVHQQLNGDSSNVIMKQLEEIETLIQSLKSQKEYKLEQIKEIEKQVPKPDILNYEGLKEDIISALKNWGPKSLVMISRLTKIDEPIAFVILKSLKDERLVDLNKQFEWELIE